MRNEENALVAGYPGLFGMFSRASKLLSNKTKQIVINGDSLPSLFILATA